MSALIPLLALLICPWLAAKPNPQTAALNSQDVSVERGMEGLIDSGKLEMARSKLREFVETHGENFETWYMEARILFGEHKFEQSLEMLERSFALNKKDSRVYLLSGMNWVVLERLDLARPFFEEAVRLSPKDALMYYHLGRYYYTAQHFALSEQSFQEAVHLEPSMAKGFDNLGLAQEAQRKDSEAILSYRRAIALTEEQGLKYEWPYVNLAKFLLERGRQDEALPVAEKACRTNPRSAEALYVQGKSLSKLGRTTEALAALERSAEIDASFADTHYLLGRIYLKQGRKTEAERELEVFERIKKEGRSKGSGMAPPRGR